MGSRWLGLLVSVFLITGCARHEATLPPSFKDDISNLLSFILDSEVMYMVRPSDEDKKYFCIADDYLFIVDLEFSLIRGYSNSSIDPKVIHLFDWNTVARDNPDSYLYGKSILLVDNYRLTVTDSLSGKSVEETLVYQYILPSIPDMMGRFEYLQQLVADISRYKAAYDSSYSPMIVGDDVIIKSTHPDEMEMVYSNLRKYTPMPLLSVCEDVSEYYLTETDIRRGMNELKSVIFLTDDGGFVMVRSDGESEYVHSYKGR